MDDYDLAGIPAFPVPIGDDQLPNEMAKLTAQDAALSAARTTGAIASAGNAGSSGSSSVPWGDLAKLGLGVAAQFAGKHAGTGGIGGGSSDMLALHRPTDYTPRILGTNPGPQWGGNTQAVAARLLESPPSSFSPIHFSPVEPPPFVAKLAKQLQQ
jgi:hypothetical protein